MSRHDDTVSLRQMLDHIEETAAIAQGRTREDLESDRILWEIVATDFPPLAEQIKGIVPPTDGAGA